MPSRSLSNAGNWRGLSSSQGIVALLVFVCRSSTRLTAARVGKRREAPTGFLGAPPAGAPRGSLAPEDLHSRDLECGDLRMVDVRRLRRRAEKLRGCCGL